MYKDVMMMVREDYKAFLISLYRSEDQCFVIQGRRVCARFLQKGFGFSNDLQSSVKNTPGAVAGPTALALPRDVNRITKKDHIINFLRNYAERYGDMMPNAWFVNLPDIVRKEVYEKFKENFRSHHRYQAPPTSATFYSVWKSHCNTIRTRRNHGFAKCETSIFLKAEVANNRNNASRERTARDSLRQHLELIKEERRGYHNRCERAMRYPRKYMSILVDGADQKVFEIPHFREKSKSDRGHKMKVKCVGVLEHRSDKKLWLYAMTEEFLTGANHIIEVVHRTLEERKKEIRKLPEILYVQVDNCTRENKNRYFMSYHEMLVALGVFVEVEVSFLPIGHTHTDIDQAFSALSKVMKRSDARTMAEALSVLDKCYSGKATSIRMEKVANYSGLCEEKRCLINSRSLGNFTDYRYFRFTRTAGERIQCTQLGRDLFPTVCHVKVQTADVWNPLSLGPRKGFFKFIPDLSSTPRTETFPPDNVTEVNKHISSIHSRDRQVAALCVPQLQKLRDEVYTKRFHSFHWNLEECFEMHGDYLSDEADDDGIECDEGNEGASTEEGLIYETDTFIAVKTSPPAKSPFWVAMVLQVDERDCNNSPRWLRVLWYSQKADSENHFTAKYVPSLVYCAQKKRHIPYEDQVDVNSVLVQFDSLNSQGYLRANTRSALRQTLGLN